MTITTDTVTALAARLQRAAVEVRAGTPLSDDFPDLTEADAYAIQAELLRLKGTARTGYKLGFTSAAMREQMGVDHPNSGVLLADMRLADGRLPAGVLIQPRVEPEIAILLGCDLHGAQVTPDDVAAATAAVLPAIEVVDSRYRDYRFKSVDNIADNSSAARYVLGAPRALSDVGDLRLVGVLLSIDGVPVDQGIGASGRGFTGRRGGSDRRPDARLCAAPRADRVRRIWLRTGQCGVAACCAACLNRRRNGVPASCSGGGIEPVATVAFGLIQGLVGAADQLIAVATRPQQGVAARAGKHTVLQHRQTQPAQALEQGLDQARHLRGVVHEQQHGELLAAAAGD
jgi:2-keto-4-pentenoate hydratase